MKKERMAILKMVNDGKITVDEAIKLMESIKESKSFDAGDVIDSVKEKVCDFMDDAKPVVKKCADKAVEVGEDVLNKSKAKIDEYKNKAKNKDFVDDVIIEPMENMAEKAADVIDDITDDVKETVEDVKEDITEDIIEDKED